MKNMLFAFTLIIFMFGCATLPKSYTPVGHDFTNSNSNLACQDLYKDIAQKWGHHKDFNTCYYYNQKLVDEIMKMDSCFLNLKREDVEIIFGKPTIVYENKLQYNMSVYCEASDTLLVSPYSLYFKIKDNEVVLLQKLKSSIIN